MGLRFLKRESTLEFLMKTMQGEAMHPNAQRYMLYKALERMEEELEKNWRAIIHRVCSCVPKDRFPLLSPLQNHILTESRMEVH